MELRFIDPAHPLNPQELELRYQVLRAPLGMDRASVKSAACSSIPRAPTPGGSSRWP
jgi:hypothetical protein